MRSPITKKLSCRARSPIADVLAPLEKEAYTSVNYLNNDNEEEGPYTTIRTLGYEGEEAYCPTEAGEYIEHKITIKAGRGYDSMTGVGSPGPEFIKDASTP